MAGLYLHIPFCKQACHYCDFHFSTSMALKSRLVEALTLQLKGQLTVANRPGAYYHLRIGKSVTAETT